MWPGNGICVLASVCLVHPSLRAGSVQADSSSSVALLFSSRAIAHLLFSLAGISAQAATSAGLTDPPPHADTIAASKLVPPASQASLYVQHHCCALSSPAGACAAGWAPTPLCAKQLGCSHTAVVTCAGASGVNSIRPAGAPVGPGYTQPQSQQKPVLRA